MAKNRIYNKKSRIIGYQSTIPKAIVPGMFISFQYKKENTLDKWPIVLVLYRDLYMSNEIQGINLNYLTNERMTELLESLISGASVYSKSKNIIKTEDQDDSKYDDTIPYRNLLKKPYTRIKLPVFKEIRDGNPLSESQARTQMDILYTKVIKRFMNQKSLDVYRRYKFDKMSTVQVLEFDYIK